MADHARVQGRLHNVHIKTYIQDVCVALKTLPQAVASEVKWKMLTYALRIK